MTKESGTTNNPRYQDCVSGLPGWHLSIDDGLEDLAEINSPSGMTYTSIGDFQGELLKQGYSQEYVSRYIEESTIVRTIWDCIDETLYRDTTES